MSGKYIVFSDAHMHVFTEFAKPDKDYVNTRFKEQVEALEKVVELANDSGSDILFAGDMFHKRGSVDTRVINRVFDTLAKSENTVHLLRGNHDSVTNSLYTDTSLHPLTALPNVRLYSEPEVVEYTDHRLVMVPYGDEVDIMKDFIRENAKDDGKKNILVGHFGVEGALTGNGNHRLAGAFTYSDLQPDKYDYILLGHYHRRNVFNGNPKHIYVGSTMQNSFSDTDEEKGAYLVEVESNSITFLPIHTKRFITIKGDDIPDNLEELMQNHYVRFLGSPEQVKVMERLPEDIDLSNTRVMLERDYTVASRLNIDQSSSPEEITKAYTEKHHPKALEEAMECIREAK